MASSLARTALCAFSATPSSIFPQKILHSCPLPALPFPACRKDTPGYRHPPLPLSCFSSDNANVPAVPGNKTPRAFPPCGPRPAGLHAARRAKTWHPSPQGRLPAHRHFPPPRTLPAFQPLSGNKKGSPKAPGHATSASCPTRHNFPAAPRDGDGPSPAFPYPRTGGPDGASSGRRSGRSCPPARPR